MRSTVAIKAALPISAVLATASAAGSNNFTNNILITGYWPPTNEGVRQFSQNLDQNPGGWQGGNWRGRGYDIHSYFPEFPDGVGQGVGDFEVDYQDTVSDWERIVNEVNPVAIITFSRGARGRNWEIEGQLQMHAPGDWLPDFSEPSLPDASMPIFDDLVPGEFYPSTLPTEAIREAVLDAGIIPNTFIDDSGGGAFLSEFIGLLGTRHQLLNSGPDAEFRTFAAGHIHVGTRTPDDLTAQAAEISIETLIDYLDTVVPAPSTVVLTGLGGLIATKRRR
ncbi:MAG: PEP-CTERM sorting domain-containing protein [Planctomycetota bacterium]